MNVEIERKFVPAGVPSNVPLGTGTPMRQGYIAEEGDATVRIRITADDAVLTIKAGSSGLSRTEVEVSLTPDQADALWPHTVGRRVEKTRYRVTLGDSGLTAEVDVYAGDLAGLCTVEVEFESEDQANEFTPPDWMGRDVSNERQWSNAALARKGRPDAT